MVQKTLVIVLTIASTLMFSQVGINTTTPSPASVLDINSSSDGVNYGGFMIPRVSLLERNAIPVTAADDGLMVFLIEGNTRCIQIYNGVDTQWENAYCMPVNQAPTATAVTNTGSSYDVGITLTGSYTYQDVEGDPEGASTYQWYQADDALGTNSVAISGATSLSYTLQVSDIGKYISFAVVPVATVGTLVGVETFSTYNGPVDPNDAPVASGVNHSGCEIVGELLTGVYTYSDAENDLEGTSTYQWYSATDASGTGVVPIAGATSSTYTVQAGDVGNYIAFEVTPVAATGTPVGNPVRSSYQGAVVASGTCGPVLLGIQDFEATPATPTLTLTEILPGTYETGTGIYPASNKYVSPVRGYGISNGTAEINLGAVDASAYFSATVKLHLASFSTTSGNGADGTDTVVVSISTDGGTTFSDEIRITGSSNRKWDFNASGVATVAYDGDNVFTSFTSPNGATGIANLEVTGVPNSANIVVKVTMLNNNVAELWVIDDVEVFGNP